MPMCYRILRMATREETRGKVKQSRSNQYRQTVTGRTVMGGRDGGAVRDGIIRITMERSGAIRVLKGRRMRQFKP